jgi:hypothetical protein
MPSSGFQLKRGTTHPISRSNASAARPRSTRARSPTNSAYTLRFGRRELAARLENLYKRARCLSSKSHLPVTSTSCWPGASRPGPTSRPGNSAPIGTAACDRPTTVGGWMKPVFWRKTANTAGADLNNVPEQDHRAIKRRGNVCFGRQRLIIDRSSGRSSKSWRTKCV